MKRGVDSVRDKFLELGGDYARRVFDFIDGREGFSPLELTSKDVDSYPITLQSKNSHFNYQLILTHSENIHMLFNYSLGDLRGTKIFVEGGMVGETPSVDLDNLDCLDGVLQEIRDIKKDVYPHIS
jgi:hypothetical protein